jgi:hypothetical protein
MAIRCNRELEIDSGQRDEFNVALHESLPVALSIAMRAGQIRRDQTNNGHIADWARPTRLTHFDSRRREFAAPQLIGKACFT